MTAPVGGMAGRRLSLLLALALLPALALVGACASNETSTPTPNPYLIPGTHAVEYRDEELGIGFSRPDDWSVTDPSETRGIVVSVESPDGSVTIDIERGSPPPQIDVMSYGSARMDFFQRAQPSLTVLEEIETTLTDGTPAYRAEWVSRLEDAETSGETIVAFRGDGDEREAFLIISAGPTALYRAWTGPILFFQETLSLDPMAG